MTALLQADRWGLACGDPTHLGHKTVFMTCAERERLEAYLAVTAGKCFELVDLAAVEVSDVQR